LGKKGLAAGQSSSHQVEPAKTLGSVSSSISTIFPFVIVNPNTTRDTGRALNAARALRYGTVWINDHLPLVSEMPHGGFKQSGYGKDMSAYAIDDYTLIKHVMAKFG
jgi:aldehyde dehydrogenase family protein